MGWFRIILSCGQPSSDYDLYHGVANKRRRRRSAQPDVGAPLAGAGYKRRLRRRWRYRHVRFLAEKLAGVSESASSILRTVLLLDRPRRLSYFLDADRPVTLEDQIVTINVSGERFQTYESTLQRLPDSLLGNVDRRRRYFHPELMEYFFDRHRRCFEAILYIYQSGGRVARPPKVSIELFVKELQFFDVGKEVMDRFWLSEGYEAPAKRLLPANRVQRIIWETFEHADSSTVARALAFFSVLVIVASIVNVCLETIAPLREPYEIRDNATGNLTGTTVSSFTNPFFVAEVFCISWFSLEFVARINSCPDKKAFMKNGLNIIDVASIMPFYVNLLMGDSSGGGGAKFSTLRVLRLVRVFRIFKLSRHSVGLQILAKTFSASVQELALLIFFMGIAVVLFASAAYFAEQGVPDNDFTSIPAGFWYVIVTMTTVGYGDMVPKGLLGQIVGSVALLFGVLTIAMPVPIIVANFKQFYDQETRLAALRRALGRPPPPDSARADDSHRPADADCD